MKTLFAHKLIYVLCAYSDAITTESLETVWFGGLI